MALSRHAHSKKAIFSAVTPFSKKKLGQQVDPIRTVTHVTNGVLGHKVDPIRNVCYSESERKEEAKKRLEKRLEKRENT